MKNEENSPKNKNRVIIFIDGNNFYYKLKDITSEKEEILKLLDFNYQGFVKNLIKENVLVEIRYYVGAIRRQNGPNREKSEKLYANQQKLIAKYSSYFRQPDTTPRQKFSRKRCGCKNSR